MKTQTPACRRPLWQLLAFSLLLVTGAPAVAEETLRYAVVVSGNFPLLCDDLRDAPAGFLVAGQEAVAADGSPRCVSFVGSVSLEGKQAIQLGGGLGIANPAQSPDGGDHYVSITIERAPGILPAAFSVDAEIRETHDRYEGRTGNRYSGRSRVPARANAWQEVMSWGQGALSLWQYYTPAEEKAPRLPSAEDKIVPVYRLEVMLGQFSRQALEKLPSSDPEHRRLIAELGRWRQNLATHVSPGVPFRAATSHFQVEKLTDENHEASGVDRIEGSVVQNPSHLVLKLDYQSPAPRKQDRRVTPLGLEMSAGDWYYQQIEDPPPHAFQVEGAWCDTSWGEKDLGSQCINVAAYRLTKVSPDNGEAPSSHPSP